jgi:RNA polymerase sigma-70 factor, ECF subfamily
MNFHLPLCSNRKLPIMATHTRIRVGKAMSAQTTDELLVQRVQRGDKKAFDLLVLKYQHKIMSLVSRFIRDHAEVQDVTQEAFIKAYRALPNFRGDSQFYTWLYRIAINTAKNHLVSQGRRPPAFDMQLDDEEQFSSDEALRDNATPDNLIARDQLQSVVFGAIEKLPEELKVAITLRELDGMSYEEIAEAMQCPIGTVRSRIFRARESVEKAMAPLLDQTA